MKEKIYDIVIERVRELRDQAAQTHRKAKITNDYSLGEVNALNQVLIIIEKAKELCEYFD